MFLPIPIVTTLPTAGTLPASIGALAVTNSTALEITGKVTSGAGTVTLCRWFPELGVWRPWAEYAAMTADAAANSACFSGRYKVAQTGPVYFILIAAGVVLTSAHGEGVVY